VNAFERFIFSSPHHDELYPLTTITHNQQTANLRHPASLTYFKCAVHQAVMQSLSVDEALKLLHLTPLS
jgi:hypothetical protein